MGNQAIHKCSLYIMDLQVCVFKTMATEREQTHRQTHRQTDIDTVRTVKTEGPKILSNDIFYLLTLININDCKNNIRISIC